MIKVTKALMPTTNAIFPPWQGRQYLHNMLGGLAMQPSLENGRYSIAPGTTASVALATHVNGR